jgi:Tfp pilus assembly protein PilO
MRLEGKAKSALIGAMLGVAALAVAFWMLALSPVREEAKKLGVQVEKLEGSLSQHRAEVAAGEEARKGFPVAYRKLVVLGKAVPAEAETASLLVQVNRIADRSKVRFETLKLEAGSEGEAAAEAPAGESGESVSPTEAAAALLPLGASIGSAGLATMPYTLTFKGDFFQIADFFNGLDDLVKTNNEGALANGRLITINGFSLTEDSEGEFPALEATFSITTYLTPPEQGLTAGASPEGPEAVTSVPASATTGGAP